MLPNIPNQFAGQREIMRRYNQAFNLKILKTTRIIWCLVVPKWIAMMIFSGAGEKQTYNFASSLIKHVFLIKINILIFNFY